MKNKKVVIIVSVILLIVIAIIMGVRNFYSSYMFNEDGTIDDPRQVFYQQLNNPEISGDDRITLINFGAEHNIITQKEAEKLLNENK